MEMAEKDGTEGRCPACRTPYDRERIVATTVTCDRLTDVNDKKQKSSKAKAKVAEGRKNLSNVRVIQRNLVYVVGVPGTLADEETLEGKDYFGQYGKILKISVSKSSGHTSQHSTMGSTVSVYVTYLKEEDALRCIQAVNGYSLEGKVLKACFGTTKYCNAWLKHMPCNNPDCLYLHDEGTREDSFTKEEMLGKYGSKNQHFHDLTHPSQRRFGVGLPPPILDVSAVSSTSHAPAPAASGIPTKPFFLNGSSIKPSSLPAAASWASRATPSTSRTSLGRTGAGSSTKLKTGTGPVVSAGSSAMPMSASMVSDICGATASGQSIQASSLKQYGGVKSVKVNMTNETDKLPSMSICATGTAKLSEVTDSEVVSSTVMQRVDPEIVSCVDALEAQQRTDVSRNGLGQEAFNGSHLGAAESLGFGTPSRGVEDLNPGEALFPFVSDDDDGRSVTDLSGQGECSGTSPCQDSFGALYVPSCGSSYIGEKAMNPVMDSEISTYGVLNSLNFDSGDGPASSNGLFSTFDETSNCNSVYSEQDSLIQAKRVVSGTSEAQTVSHSSPLINTHNQTANAGNDSMQQPSLSVGALSIHLNPDIPSSKMVKPGENMDSAKQSTSSKTSTLDALSSICFESMSDADGDASTVKSDRRNLLKEGSLQAGNRSENGDLNGYWESENAPTRGNGEHELISDMFGMGFDIWADGNPQDLAQLLFNGKNAEPSSSSNYKEMPTSRKSSSSKQSRFQFARFDESMEELSSPSRSVCQTPPCSHGNDGEILAERCNRDQYSTDISCISELPADVSPYSFADKLLTKATSSGSPSDSCVPSSKSSISAPPGFSMSARVSTVSPPGFSLQSRPRGYRKSTDANPGSEINRSLASPGTYEQFEAFSSSNDVEFVDPAIMAVGKGKVPAGIKPMATFAGNSPLSGLFSQAPSLSTSLSPQIRSLDFDSSFQYSQRHLYGNFGSMNSVSPLSVTNQEPADTSLLSHYPSSFNEGMNPPRLMGQYQDIVGSSVSHVGLQEPAGYGNGVLKFRLQPSPSRAWDNWNNLTSSPEANTGAHRLVNDAVGRMNVSQMSLERVLQSRFEELALSKESGGLKYYGDAVSLTGHDDQGPFSNDRISRYFLQN